MLVALATTALAQDSNEIPDLKPPLPELPPNWWDQNFWAVIGTTLMVFAVAMALVRLLFRPRLARALMPEVVARAALEKLRGAPDTAETAAEVGRQLRRFTQAALALPAGELTTDETLRALAARPAPAIGARTSLSASPSDPPGQADKNVRAPFDALLQELTTLLRECDARHFAPAPPPGQPALAERALAAVAKIESFLQPPVQTGNPPKS